MKNGRPPGRKKSKIPGEAHTGEQLGLFRKLAHVRGVVSMEEKNIVVDRVKILEESREYKKIKNSLVAQLKATNANTPYFLSLIKDYMSMWVSKELLYQDIQERGCIVIYDNGGGQRGCKRNDSIADFNKTNAQMLKLLSELKINPETVSTNTDSDDEL